MTGVEETAILIAKLAALTNLIVVSSQALREGQAILAKAHAENREASQAEIDAVFGEDSAHMQALDEHIKTLGA